MMGDNAALEELTWKAPTPTSQPASQPKEKK
jgi:hypothetical protein